MSRLDYISGQTYHGRKGDIANAFRYSIDYVLLDAEDPDPGGPAMFGRNKRGAFSVHDSDHGGAPKQGRGAAWVREVLAAHQITLDCTIHLLTQPRMLGYVFNPVSFWLCLDSNEKLRAVIAEVTNTYGDRHSYLCRKDDLSEINPLDVLQSEKLLHVSPFQPLEGGYSFRFDISDDRIGIWIDFNAPSGGVIATLTGQRSALTNRAIVGALLRRPFGSRRVLALIHWQALKLWWKGAVFRNRPEPPGKEVS